MNMFVETMVMQSQDKRIYDWDDVQSGKNLGMTTICVRDIQKKMKSESKFHERLLQLLEVQLV